LAKKREIEIVVISDIHLGTVGCRAKELLRYLKSINAQTYIFNGDIIDMWQFKKRYWPKSHMQIIRTIIKLITKGKNVYYLTGNHDEMLRRFVPFNLEKFNLLNKKVIEIDGKKTWFFHGDVFDVSMQHSKWLAKLGAIGYDSLILLNTFVNFVSDKFGRGRISLSKKIKDSVKGAIKFIDDFEQTAANIAIENKYDYVVCGHIHQPSMRTIKNKKGSVVYLNSGDWIENMTALEYNNKEWTLYKYEEDKAIHKIVVDELNAATKSDETIFDEMLENFKK